MAPEEGDVGFEDGMSWLPSHVLREACDVKVQLGQQVQEHERSRRQQPHHRPPFPAQAPPTMHFGTGPKFPPNRPIGGPGMQVVFLKSDNQSGGTGVFLPPTAGSKFHANKKPGSSPVLLPSRVVKALNLNVHALSSGFDASSKKDKKLESNGDLEVVDSKNKMAKTEDVSSSRRCISTPGQVPSAEIFLPKEWSY